MINQHSGNCRACFKVSLFRPEWTTWLVWSFGIGSSATFLWIKGSRPRKEYWRFAVLPSSWFRVRSIWGIRALEGGCSTIFSQLFGVFSRSCVPSCAPFCCPLPFVQDDRFSSEALGFLAKAGHIFLFVTLLPFLYPLPLIGKFESRLQDLTWYSSEIGCSRNISLFTHLWAASFAGFIGCCFADSPICWSHLSTRLFWLSFWLYSSFLQ